MFKYDLNIYKKYEYKFILESNKIGQSCKKSKGWLLTLKSQNVCFLLWKVKIWLTIDSNVIWILRKWVWIHAWRLELVNELKMVKSQNEMVKWPFCPLTKISVNIQHFVG